MARRWKAVCPSRGIADVEVPYNCSPPLSNILGGFAGVTSDANTLVNYARNTCQNVLLKYDDDIPVEHLTQYMCDLKQGYTQYGGEQQPHYTR